MFLLCAVSILNKLQMGTSVGVCMSQGIHIIQPKLVIWSKCRWAFNNIPLMIHRHVNHYSIIAMIALAFCLYHAAHMSKMTTCYLQTCKTLSNQSNHCFIPTIMIFRLSEEWRRNSVEIRSRKFSDLWFNWFKMNLRIDNNHWSLSTQELRLKDKETWRRVWLQFPTIGKSELPLKFILYWPLKETLSVTMVIPYFNSEGDTSVGTVLPSTHDPISVYCKLKQNAISKRSTSLRQSYVWY